MKINHIKVYLHQGKIAEYIDAKDFTLKDLIPENLICENQLYVIYYSFKALNKNYKIFQIYFVKDSISIENKPSGYSKDEQSVIRFFKMDKKRELYDTMKISNNYWVGDSYSQKISIQEQTDRNLFMIFIENKNKVKKIILHTSDINIVSKFLNRHLKNYELLYIDLDTYGCKLNSKLEFLEYSKFNKVFIHIRYSVKKSIWKKIFQRENEPKIMHLK
jgi:hypothetical protein